MSLLSNLKRNLKIEQSMLEKIMPLLKKYSHSISTEEDDKPDPEYTEEIEKLANYKENVIDYALNSKNPLKDIQSVLIGYQDSEELINLEKLISFCEDAHHEDSDFETNCATLLHAHKEVSDYVKDFKLGGKRRTKHRKNSRKRRSKRNRPSRKFWFN